MGRRRRRVIRIVKKKLPTVFVCPRCGEEAVRVSIDKTTGNAIVACAICQLKDEFMAHPQAQAIDVYSYFTDRFYGVKDPRAIIPRDRPASLEKAVTGKPESEEEEAGEDTETPSRLEPEGEEGRPPDIIEQQPPDQVGIGSEETTRSDTGSSVESNVEDMKNPEPVETPSGQAEEREEEENPFGDILQSESEKEKKQRYSPHPIQQESSSSSE